MGTITHSIHHATQKIANTFHDPLMKKGDNLFYKDVIGGDPPDDAAKAAQEAEAARQAGIQRSIAQINQVYGSPERAQQYTDFENALQQQNLLKLDQQQQDANRNLTFAMARQGLTGGSADADANADQERLYNEALLKGQQATSGAAAQLRAQDQQSKNNLISLAESGLDATTAANQGLQSLQINRANAMANAQAQDLGNAFSGLGDYFTASQKAKQLRDMTVNPTTNGLWSIANPQATYTGPGAVPWLGGQ